MASRNSQRARTLQETVTSLSPSDVLSEAKRFFSRQSGVYAAFVEQEHDIVRAVDVALVELQEGLEGLLSGLLAMEAPGIRRLFRVLGGKSASDFLACRPLPDWPAGCRREAASLPPACRCC